MGVMGDYKNQKPKPQQNQNDQNDQNVKIERNLVLAMIIRRMMAVLY